MTVHNFTPANGFTASHRKDNAGLTRAYKVVDLDRDGRDLLDVRFYAPGSVTYCCAWVSDPAGKREASGTGRATGYGYHKSSAALYEALTNAGVEMDAFGGRGDEAEAEALLAVARYLGYQNTLLVKVYP